MKQIAKQLASELAITGPFNIQFLVRDGQVFIIETNLRASRTFPFIAKVTGINLISLFVDSLFKKTVATVPTPTLTKTAVKVPQFSFARLIGAHPTLGVEMASTGEVACFGEDLEEAYLKGVLATGGKIPQKGIFVTLGGEDKKQAFLESCKLLTKLGLPIYSTEKTAKFLNDNGIKTTKLYKIYENKSPNVLDHFQSGKIDLVINAVDLHFKPDIEDYAYMRRVAVDNNIPVMTKIKNAELFVQALVNKGITKLETKPWSKYL